MIIERFRGTIFRAKIRMGATDFFQGCSVRFFGTENPCGLAFIRTMLRMEILRHRVQNDFSRTNLVRETSIFRGNFGFRCTFSKYKGIAREFDVFAIVT